MEDKIKPWHEVVTPHADIRAGKFDESVFAADLSDVIADRGPLEYRDAATFFKKTYPTVGLGNLLVAVLSRLAGTGKGEPVIPIETPFGGGKTHSLIALYHLFSGGDGQESLDKLGAILQEAKTKSVPRTRVAVFVGTTADPVRGRTPWGELAQQLGNYGLLEDTDKRRRAPGKDLLHRLLGDQPTLILMDEITQYRVKAKDFGGQVIAFFQELTEAVKVLPHCALVVTLPSSAPYGEEGERALHELHQVFGRLEAIYTPVEGEEIYEVIRRRLFEDEVDPAEARKTADGFWELYRRLGDDLPREARETAYRERMRKAYPFHPELIDILFERWSTYSTFQRTRGVLRLLAEVVSDLYRREHPSPLILPAHLNLGNPALRRELVKHIGNTFDSVIASDIAGPSAKAPRIDSEMGSEYARFGIASGLATAIFFGSFSGGGKRGVGIQRLRLALLREGIQPAIVADALRRMEEELWYLHVEGSLYYFSSEVGLPRLIVEKEEAVREEHIAAYIRARIDKVVGNELQAVVWPKENQDVADTKALKAALLAPDYTRQSGATEPYVESLLRKCGEPFRTYQNTVLILVSDGGELGTLRQQVKRLLALQAIHDDKALYRQLSEDNRQLLATRIRDTDGAIGFQVLSAYRHLAKAGEGGVEWFGLGLPTTGERTTLTRRVREYLLAEDLLLTRIPPERLLDKTLSAGDKEKPVEEIVAAFLKYPHLPMLDNETIVRQSIQQGVLEGLFAVRSGERVYCREAVPESVLEYGALLLREPPPAPPPPPPPPPLPGHIGADEIVHYMGSSETQPLGEVYTYFWTQRGREFTSEDAFRQAFRQALLDAQDRRLLETKPPLTKEGWDWAAALRNASIVRVLGPPPPPPPATAQVYSLRARVPWDKLSDFVRGVVSPLHQDGAELEVEVSLRATSQPGGFKKSTLEQKVRETLLQIGAEIREEREE
jgi:hypothetical protein